MAGPGDRTVVYTDGACVGNPGPGGWAWAVLGGPFAAGAEAATTNQRMEIRAALEAVQANEGALEIASDSTYVVNCFRDRWWEGWLRKGWINSQRKPVANRDLWEPLIELVQDRDVTFRWVKGHSGDEGNDLVDRLAVEAAETQQDRSGAEPPASVGAADRQRRRRPAGGTGDRGGEAGAGEAAGAAAGRAADPWQAGHELLGGHALVVLGHRPPELGGYEHDNPMLAAVEAKLAEILEAKATVHADLVVVSGLRLGAELLGAEAALGLGLPVVAVLPYPEPDGRWPEASRARFAHVVEHARDVVLLQRAVPDSTAKAGGALRRRDSWLARFCDEAVVVWDGRDELLGRLVRSLEDHLGEDVWIVDPTELAVAPPGGGDGSRRR